MINRFVTFIFLSIFVGPTLLRADDCGTTIDEGTAIDLRGAGKSMEGMPNLEQDGTNNCYSQAAAAILSAYLRSKTPNLSAEEKEKLLISPFIMAILGKIETQVIHRKTGSEISSFSICSIIHLIHKYGACALTEVTLLNEQKLENIDLCSQPMDLTDVRWNTYGPSRRMRSILNSFQTKLLKSKTDAKLISSVKEHYEGIREANQIGKKNPQNWFRLSPAEIDARVNALADKRNPDNELFSPIAIMAPECLALDEKNNLDFKGHFKLGEPLGLNGPILSPIGRCVESSANSPKEVFLAPRVLERTGGPPRYLSVLNERMDKNDQPIGINFCWPFLIDETSEGRLWDKLRFWQKRPWNWNQTHEYNSWACQFRREPTGDHKALIIGRRLKEGKCEFLLRNSWGNECAMYVGEYKHSCEEELRTHHHADVWIPATVLPRSMHGYSYLE